MLRRNVIANYAGQAWTVLIGFAFVPVYIRYLGIESFGLIGLFAMLQGWLALLDMGMSPTLGREMARLSGGTQKPESIRDLLRSIETICLVVALVIVFGMWASSGWLASHWLKTGSVPQPVVAQAFLLMGFVAAIRFMEGIYLSCLVGLQRQVLSNGATALLATVRSVGILLIFHMFGASIIVFFEWQAAMSVVTVALLAALTYRSVPKIARNARFSGSALRSVGRFAGGMTGITLVGVLVTQVDKLVLSRAVTLKEFGYYSLASTVAAVIFSVVYPLARAWQPRIVQLLSSNETGALVRLYHLGSQLVAVGAGSVAAVMALFAYQVLLLWTHDPELAGKTATVLSIIAIGNLLNGLMVLPYYLQTGAGWTRLAFLSNVVVLVFALPAIMYVAPVYRGTGVAIVWLLSNVFHLIFTINIMHQRLLRSEMRAWYVKDTIIPIVSATLAVVLVKILFRGISDGSMWQLVPLALAGLASIAASAFSAPAVRLIVLDRIGYRRARWAI
ncbi:oligosaccharide flippase family protein [Sphingomonas faeni]|uniref:oligosaccharide flippase family protein n=1 Tax=Sphingomonas faeni TaxID=185950 RepID=UPI00335D0186